MSGEAPRTLSAVTHPKVLVLPVEGYCRAGPDPNMDAFVTVPSVCTAHSTLLVLSIFLDAPAKLNMNVRWSGRGWLWPNILCKQCTHADKGKG